MDKSVAYLTTEQLYRKRAFDRANQRACRTRKRSRIQELEETVADLKQRLARSEACVKRLQDSEASLREIINSARASLQMVDHHGPSQLTSAEQSPSQFILASVPEHDSPASNLESLEASTALDTEQHSNSSQSAPTCHSNSPTTALVPTIDGTGVALKDSYTGLTLELPLSRGEPMSYAWNCSYLRPDPNDGQDWSNELLNSALDHPNAFSLSIFDTTSSQDMDKWPLDIGLQSLEVEDTASNPPWTRLPLHLDATCRLDLVLLNILQSSREHVPTLAEASRSSFPSIGSLLNPATCDMENPISNALGLHGKVNMAIPGLPERVACLYYMSHLLRWLVSPTQRNYEALPEYIRPTDAQLAIPHPIWIDTLVWPEAREKIIRSKKWPDFDTFRQMTSETLSIGWSHESSSIFTAVSPTELQLNSNFESYIRQIKHWTVGDEVLREFPLLAGVLRT